jgi:hypothetical protein
MTPINYAPHPKPDRINWLGILFLLLACWLAALLGL